MNGRRDWKILLGGAVIGFMINGCGGGSTPSSEQGDEVPTQDTMAMIDQTNKTMVIASLMTGQEETDSLINDSFLRKSVKSLKRIGGGSLIDNMLITKKVEKRLDKTYSDTYSCSVSGDIYVRGDDSGNYEITYNHCNDGYGEWNGYERVENSGDRIYAYYDHLSYVTDSQEFMIERLDETITLNDDGYIQKLDYTISGYFHSDESDIAFSNYRVTEELEDDMLRESIHGYVNTSCLSGWLKVDEEVVYDTWDGSYYGEVFYTGKNSELHIVYEESGEVDVYLNGTLTDHYNSEEDFESYYYASNSCQS